MHCSIREIHCQYCPVLVLPETSPKSAKSILVGKYLNLTFSSSLCLPSSSCSHSRSHHQVCLQSYNCLQRLRSAYLSLDNINNTLDIQISPEIEIRMSSQPPTQNTIEGELATNVSKLAQLEKTFSSLTNNIKEVKQQCGRESLMAKQGLEDLQNSITSFQISFANNYMEDKVRILEDSLQRFQTRFGEIKDQLQAEAEDLGQSSESLLGEDELNPAEISLKEFMGSSPCPIFDAHSMTQVTESGDEEWEDNMEDMNPKVLDIKEALSYDHVSPHEGNAQEQLAYWGTNEDTEKLGPDEPLTFIEDYFGEQAPGESWDDTDRRIEEEEEAKGDKLIKEALQKHDESEENRKLLCAINDEEYWAAQ